MREIIEVKNEIVKKRNSQYMSLIFSAYHLFSIFHINGMLSLKSKFLSNINNIFTYCENFIYANQLPQSY